MKKVINILNEVVDKSAEGWMIAVFVFSVCPFLWPDWKGHLFYTFIGGYCAFFSVLFIHLNSKYETHNRSRNIYSVFALFILGLGITAIFILKGKMANDPNYTPDELFLTTYFGALMGMIMSGIVCGEIFKKKLT